MKAFRILAAVVTVIASAFTLMSCEPVKQSTMYERFYRVGTVRLTGNIASIDFDNSNEAYIIDNFKSEADMAKFGVKAGDRVFLALDFNAEGSMENATITLSMLSKIETLRFETTAPSDTLNYYYQFSKFSLYNTEYPSIWTSGHIVNLAPTYFVPEKHEPVKFFLNPIAFEHDTLFTRLYSYIPDCDVSLNPAYTQSLLCYDMSSLRDRSSDPANQELRDTILARMDRMENDYFTFTVMTPDTLRAKNAKNTESDYLQPIANPSKSIRVKYDF